MKTSHHIILLLTITILVVVLDQYIRDQDKVSNLEGLINHGNPNIKKCKNLINNGFVVTNGTNGPQAAIYNQDYSQYGVKDGQSVKLNSIISAWNNNTKNNQLYNFVKNSLNTNVVAAKQCSYPNDGSHYPLPKYVYDQNGNCLKDSSGSCHNFEFDGINGFGKSN